MTASPDVYPALTAINSAVDLRQLSPAQLPVVADELRRYLLESVSRTGGHLAAGLGTVELTVALHYVFNTPHDRLVWDVGHQTYPHKILTGRRDDMPSLRKKNGLCGFPNRDESEYDTFGVGHSSTSISAALGMALASAYKSDDPRSVVAVIGDGALTAGMAFEALNHAGGARANMLVILNDNRMSISPNVGGLSNYLARIMSGKLYSSLREESKKVLSLVPSVREFARRAEEHMKGMIIPGTLFEELGFNYFGPIDGHDLDTLVPTLRNLRNQSGPRFLHIHTRKGKGYGPAEEDPCVYHGVTRFNPETGLTDTSSKTLTYTGVFSDWLCDMAALDERLIGITPAMREGSGLVRFSEEYPKRYFDVGIAEQHALTFAAGLACEGMKPVVAIYSTFLQRAYDQLIHDIALQNLPVLLAIDRGGVVGPDGPTHAGSFDLSYLRCIPNMVIMAPADENECRQMLYTGYVHTGPAAVRYPRGAGPGVTVQSSMSALPIGQGELRRRGKRIALLAFGAMVDPAEQAGAILNATVANMRFIKPLDESLLHKLAQEHELVLTIEDNARIGGAGSAVIEALSRLMPGKTPRVITLGLPDTFLAHASREEMLAECQLTRDGIVAVARAAMPQNPTQLPESTLPVNIQVK